MTSVREDTGYNAPPRRYPARPAARFEGVRCLGDEGWEAEVLRPDGKRTWLYGSDKTQTITRARNLAATINAGKVTP